MSLSDRMRGAGRSRTVVGLVAMREIRERGGSKSYLISTAVVVLGVVAAIVVPKVVGTSGPPTFRVAVIGRPSPTVLATLRGSASTVGGTVRVVTLRSPGQVEVALRAQRADLAILPPNGLLIRGDKTSIEVKDYANLLARMIPLQRNLEAAGVPPGRVPAVLSARPLRVRTVVPPKPSADTSQGLVFLGTLILYLSLISYGSWVGTGVTEEKSSRVVEMLVSTVRPYQLLAGKVVGIGVLGLAQLTVVAGVGLTVAAAVGNRLPSSAPGAVALLLLLFVLGFALYSCVFAAVGATASRIEDVQNAVMPISLVLVVAYLISIGGLSNPDSTLIRVSSFIPVLAPLTLPARMILGHPSPWELPVSIVVVAASAYGLVRLGGRAYSGALLRFGERVKLGQAYRSGVQRTQS